jgi:predicted GNAT family acetyltransferase
MKTVFEKNYIYFIDENGKKAAWINYEEVKPGVVNLLHTVVDANFQGQGLAGRITRELADTLRKQGKKAILTCSYSKDWFPKHPEFNDILYKNN